MELQFYGANCLRLTTKKAAIVIDDVEGAVAKNGDVLLFTGAKHPKLKVESKIVIDEPGEYEASDVSITGIAARAHLDESGKNATIFKIMVDEVRVVVLGHVYPELSDAQLESIGVVDVLVVPVGGGGYTLDATGALHLIKEIEPKLVIPVHYAQKGVKYEVPQVELDDALKNLAMEPRETTPKLKLKAGELPEVTQLVVLEAQ